MYWILVLMSPFMCHVDTLHTCCYITCSCLLRCCFLVMRWTLWKHVDHKWLKVSCIVLKIYPDALSLSLVHQI
jgi:hypothetical protein